MFKTGYAYLPIGDNKDALMLIEAMTQTIAITTLEDAENRFGFVRVEDEQFFSEWYEGLSEITEAEKASVDVVRRRSNSQAYWSVNFSYVLAFPFPFYCILSIVRY
ncbi:hypothetical protein [Nostoc sp. JL31]|uniref:hypothetical protein n=1 Tax=Nostoc sp. JL31 TaxID=2815395 RepID=UPI00345923E7